MNVILRISLGLIIWAVGFAALYAAQGLSCAYDWRATTVGAYPLDRVALTLIWASFLALIAGAGAYAAMAPLRPDALAPFARPLVCLSSLVGFAAMFLSGFPAVAASACL